MMLHRLGHRAKVLTDASLLEQRTVKSIVQNNNNGRKAYATRCKVEEKKKKNDKKQEKFLITFLFDMARYKVTVL